MLNEYIFLKRIPNSPEPTYFVFLQNKCFIRPTVQNLWYQIHYHIQGRKTTNPNTENFEIFCLEIKMVANYFLLIKNLVNQFIV